MVDKVQCYKAIKREREREREKREVEREREINNNYLGNHQYDPIHFL